MLLFSQWLPHFVQRVCFLSDEQLWGLATTGFVGRLSALEFFLEAVLIESFQLFYAIVDAKGSWRFRLKSCLNNRFFLLWWATWIGQIIKALLVIVSVAVKFQLLFDDLFEILVVSVIFVSALL